MALILPKFSNWKTLIKTPIQRKISGNKTKFKWGDLFKPISDIVGFAFGNLNLLSGWDASKIAQLFVAGKRFILNFNWNIPDENLLSMLENQRLAWYGQFGSVVGQALGWTLCGLLPAATVLYFNKPLGTKILYDVGEEAYDELVSGLAIMLQTSARIHFNEVLVHSFIKLRHIFKNAANGKADSFAEKMADGFLDMFPQFKEAAKHWGDKGGKPYIINNEVEEAIENAPLEQKWKVFLEEAWEEFNDSCDEALLAFANSYDNHVAEKALEKQVQQKPNTVVITPNRKAPEEKFILHGTTEQLKPAITQTLAQYQLIHQRDFGYDLGQPLIERAHKQISEYVIRFILRSKTIAAGAKFTQKAEITVNSANPLKFTDYDKVIRALGGGSDGNLLGYNYGSFLCIAQMSDGSTLKLYSDTRDNVILRLEAVAELSTAKIQTMNVIEEIKDYERDKIDGLAKNIIRVFPRKMEVLRKTKIYNDYDRSHGIDGKPTATKQGYYKETPYSLSLWQGSEPSNWNAIMQAITAPIPPNP